MIYTHYQFPLFGPYSLDELYVQVKTNTYTDFGATRNFNFCLIFNFAAAFVCHKKNNCYGCSAAD